MLNNCQRIANPYNKLPRIANPRQRKALNNKKTDAENHPAPVSI